MPQVRVVIYLSPAEAAKAAKRKGDHKNIHRWAASVVKKVLSK